MWRAVMEVEGDGESTSRTVLAERLERAQSFWQRFFGLMGRRALKRGTGLYLERCSAIHTHFMRFPIDVIFVGEGGEVRRVVHSMPPWRHASCKGAVGVLELPAGTLRRGEPVRGRLVLEPHPYS